MRNKYSRGKTMLAAIGAAALTVVFLVAGAGAETGLPPSGLIYACKNTGDGNVRIVAQNTLCSSLGKNWFVVNWNATGPAGTNGTNGTNGTTGATGATGPIGP